MNTILKFVRATLTGGILFMLPLVLVIMMINKANVLLQKLSEPLARRLPDYILGFDGSRILAVVLLVIICFASGLLFRSGRVRGWLGGLESGVLSYLPGYAMLKAIAADTIGRTVENTMTTVLVKDGDSWNIGFLVEERDGLCTVFLPEAPRHDSGEVKIVPAVTVKKIGISTHLVARSLKNYGKGAITWLGR